MGWNVQFCGDIKESVQRNGFLDIGGFHMTNEGRAQADLFSQLFLRQSAELSIVGNLQSQLKVIVCVFRFQIHHLYVIW